ncbi:MAG: STAS domain-containing protein [Gammaproteobacteria bacterium]
MSEARLIPGDTGFAVVGDVRLDNAMALHGAGLKLVKRPGTHLVDLKALGRVDSSCLALMLEWLRAARRAGGDLKFFSAPKQLRELIDAMGVGDALGLRGTSAS